MGVPSKAGEFDVGVELDQEIWKDLGPLLEGLRQLPAGRSLWRFTYPGFAKAFSQAALDLGLQVVPYQARHSGASIDAATRRRPLHEIKMRGGWRSDKPVARYEKSARLTQTWMAHAPRLRVHLERCSETLVDCILHGVVTPWHPLR